MRKNKEGRREEREDGGGKEGGKGRNEAASVSVVDIVASQQGKRARNTRSGQANRRRRTIRNGRN